MPHVFDLWYRTKVKTVKETSFEKKITYEDLICLKQILEHLICLLHFVLVIRGITCERLCMVAVNTMYS